MSPRKRLVALAPLLAVLAACQGTRHPPMPTVERVDLARLMGDWYVIANIPTRIERGAHSALKTYTPRGFVMDDGSNALWGMRFIWPIKADYRIIHLSPDYAETIIGRQKRDYVWIMARTPQIPESHYQRLLQVVEANGYDIS